MLNLLLGRALMRWLNDTTTAPEPPPLANNAPELDLTDYTIVERPKVEPPPEVVCPRVQRRAMGSLFEVYLAGTDRDAMVLAAEEALNDVERLERQLSHYREDSDISRLNNNAASQWVRLEPRLYALLKRCAELTLETDGAFDVTAGPLIKAWGFFRGDHRIPPDEEIADALSHVGSYRILFDDDDHLVYFTTPGLEVNLGAIGKGYAMDAAAETLRTYGVQSAVLHGGQSTIYAVGEPPAVESPELRVESSGHATLNSQPSTLNSSGWSFDIKDPRNKETVLETVYLRDAAISTSGNYEQFFEVDGVRYSHILDPLTGRPTQGMISVSVIAPNAADSDALSTAFFVLGRERTEEYCKTHPNIRVIMVEDAGGGEIAVTRIAFSS